MESIIIIHLCVLLLTFVSDGVGEVTVFEILDKLYEAADKGETVNDVFQPSKYCYLGNTMYSISCKGTLVTKDNMEVTMKFTPERKFSDKEFKIYMKLVAFGDTDSEVYGVPAIHYYGMWGECAMMAMTLFDPDYHQNFRDKKLTETDLLILFREFVRTSQYTHGRNVFYEHVQFSNMMFFGHQCFIYEFVDAAIYLDGKDEYKLCAARRGWQRFIRALYRYLRDSSSWSFLGFSDKDSQRKSDALHFISGLKNDTESKKPHKFTGLRRVLVEFARQALADDSKPITKSFYNEPFRVIFEEIGICEAKQDKKLIPSWLPNTQDNVQPSASEGSEKKNRGKASSSSSRHRRR